MKKKRTSRLEAGLIRDRSLGRALWLALALIVFLTAGGYAQEVSKTPPKAAKPAKSAAKKARPPVKPVLEPKAIDVLKAACSRLAEAKSMSFTGLISYESPSRLGPPLVYTTKVEVLMKRPDNLRVITPGDGPPSEFYYNGKTMTAFAPTENLVAVAEAPPTIDAMVKKAYDLAAIYFPFADMISADPYAIISEGLTQAFYMGQSRVVGGTTTDMVGIVNNWVFEQIWIGSEDKLPGGPGRFFSETRLDCAMRSNSPTGKLIPRPRRKPLPRRKSPPRCPSPSIARTSRNFESSRRG